MSIAETVWHYWDDAVVEAAMQGAAQAARRLDGVVELEDVQQEAHIWIATHSEELRRDIDGYGMKGVRIKVRSRMLDAFEKQQAASGRSSPLKEGWLA